MSDPPRLKNARSIHDYPVCPQCELPIEPAQGARLQMGFAVHFQCSVREPEAKPRTIPPQPTILYIEDNAANLRLVELAIERRPGVRLLSADRGWRGLELARERRPELILLDIHLPDVEGTDLLTLMRQDPILAQTPVIIVSAEDPDQVRAAGAQAYLTKPLDLVEFFAAIDTVLPRGKPSGPAV